MTAVTNNQVTLPEQLLQVSHRLETLAQPTDSSKPVSFKQAQALKHELSELLENIERLKSA